MPHPNAEHRAEIIPGEVVNVNNVTDKHGEAPDLPSATRIRWARLLTKPQGAILNGECRPDGRKPRNGFRNRVFAIDIEHCPHCGSTMKIIAAIEKPTVIAKILTHLGLPSRALPHTFRLAGTA